MRRAREAVTGDVSEPLLTAWGAGGVTGTGAFDSEAKGGRSGRG